MKKVILFLIIFMNVFSFVECSPFVSNDKQKTQDKFDILYKNEKDYKYLDYILTYNEKEVLVENYSSKDEIWNNFSEKYQKEIKEKKEILKFYEKATETEKIKYWFFINRYLIGTMVFAILILSFINFLLEKSYKIKKNKNNAYIMGWTEEKIEDEILEKDDSEQEKEINLLNNMLNMLRDYNYKINIINQGSKDEYYQLINTKDRFLKIKKDDLINICLSTKNIFVDLLKNYSKNFNEKGKWE